MSPCRHDWQFVVIALGQVTTAAMVNLAQLTQIIRIRRDRKPDMSSLWWSSLNWVDIGASAVGLCSIIAFSIHGGSQTLLIVLTCLFATMCLPILAAPLVFYRCKRFYSWLDKKTDWGPTLTRIVLFLSSICLAITFWGDWILPTVAGDNWIGKPKGDNQGFYWTYFIAKRLVLLSL